MGRNGRGGSVGRSERAPRTEGKQIAVKNMTHSSFTGNSIRDRCVVILYTVCSAGSVLCSRVLLCFQLHPALQIGSCSHLLMRHMVKVRTFIGPRLGYRSIRELLQVRFEDSGWVGRSLIREYYGECDLRVRAGWQ